MLLFPHHTYADLAPAHPDNWTHADLVWLVNAVAFRDGFTPLQQYYFFETLSCESAGLTDPAIRSGYVFHGKQEESYGISQINVQYHPDVSIASATDPVWAVNWAAERFRDNPFMWSCYGKIKAR